LLSLLGAAALGADNNRITAPDGTVSYSDRPPQGADSVFVLSAAPRAPAPAVPPAPTGGIGYIVPLAFESFQTIGILILTRVDKTQHSKLYGENIL
jgi:hypothetical protein